MHLINEKQDIAVSAGTFQSLDATLVPSPRKLNIGVVGIGRIGRQHALNALHHVPQTRLTCICDVQAENLKWAAQHLAPYGVVIYQSMDTMLNHPNLEALIIASPTHLHHTHLTAALTRDNLHILCEKPLAATAAQARSLLALTARPEHADKKIMTAYCRRFDPSYTHALAAIHNGKIGTPVVIRAENRDRFDPSESQLQYLLSSPGIFVDAGIHDVDLSLAVLGSGARPRACFAVGTVAGYPRLGGSGNGDVDNGVGVVEWFPARDGTDGGEGAAPISYYYVSRTMAHGFDNPTEITGTKGTLKINLHPRRDLVEVADGSGLGNEVVRDFYERYERAFVKELECFADCCLNGMELPYGLETAVKGLEIAEALQESLRTGRKIVWDEQGRRKHDCDGQNECDYSDVSKVGNATKAIVVNGVEDGISDGAANSCK